MQFQNTEVKMMNAVRIVTIFLVLCSISSCKPLANDPVIKCVDCIVINAGNGSDVPSCITTFMTPCKTIGYALSHVTVNDGELMLQGDHWIRSTLIVPHIHSLIIRGISSNASIINCKKTKYAISNRPRY